MNGFRAERVANLSKVGNPAPACAALTTNAFKKRYQAYTIAGTAVVVWGIMMRYLR